MDNGHDDKRDDIPTNEPEAPETEAPQADAYEADAYGTESETPEPEASSDEDDRFESTADHLDQILGDGFSQMVSDSGEDTGDLDIRAEEIDELMAGGTKGHLGLVFFLLALAVIIGLVGYIFVDPVASTRVRAFLQGDLLKIDKQKVQDLARVYDEKEARLQEKSGNIRLQYFPMTAKVTIVQQAYVFDDIESKDRKPYGDPISIDNDSLHLSEDEELPELNIQNLPIRERGKMCMADAHFYPASKIVCPGFEKCLDIPSAQPAATGTDDAEDADEGAAAAPAAADQGCAEHLENKDIYTDGYCDKVPGECKDKCECFVHTLKPADYCPENKKFYPATAGTIQRCPESDVPMDPSQVPVFVYEYSFIFEAQDYLPSVVSYTEENWKSLGSSRYVILFPTDFALLRNWIPVLDKFSKASKAIRCWDRQWENLLQTRQRERGLKEGLQALAEKEKEEEEKFISLKKARLASEMVVSEIGTLRKVKKMATIIDGRGELFWFCVSPGKCSPENMKVLMTEDEEAYWGVVQLMDPNDKTYPTLATEMAKRPILKAGLTCLGKWMPQQAKNDKERKPLEFIVVDEKLDKKAECDAALAGIQSSYPEAYQTLAVMFKDETAGASLLAGEKVQFEDYFKSKAEFGGTPEAYEDMILKAEAGARHIHFLTKLYLYQPEEFDKTMTKLIVSRQADHMVDVQEKGIWADPARGFKATLDVTWWIGIAVFDIYYNKLWEYDVQACLLFVKDRDEVRFEVDRKRFKELMDRYKKVQREHAKQARWFKESVEPWGELRQKLAEARSLAETDRKGYVAQYTEEALVALKATDPDLYWGLLRIKDFKLAKKHFSGMIAIPEPQPGYPQTMVEGDQPEYHMYMLYASVLDPENAQKGIALLEKRLEPFFMTQDDYRAKYADQVDAPTYREAISALVNADIPMKYFWLVKLLENPTTFERKLSRLDYNKTLLVAKSLAPHKYKYLRDLVWLKPELDRDDDTIPMLSDWTVLDRSILEGEKARLASWSKRKAAIERKFKRSRAAAAWLREPTMVERALNNTLKMNDRYALLMSNLESVEEGKIISAAGNAIRDVAQEEIENLAEWWKKNGEVGNQTIRAEYDFTEARWSPLVDEIKITFPKWYTYLDEGLQNKRGDCLDPECLNGWLECRLDNVLLVEEAGKEAKNCTDQNLPPCK